MGNPISNVCHTVTFLKNYIRKKNKQTSINLDLEGKFLPAQISTDNICAFLFSVTLRTLFEV